MTEIKITEGEYHKVRASPLVLEQKKADYPCPFCGAEMQGRIRGAYKVRTCYSCKGHYEVKPKPSALLAANNTNLPIARLEVNPIHKAIFLDIKESKEPITRREIAKLIGRSSRSVSSQLTMMFATYDNKLLGIKELPGIYESYFDKRYIYET